MKKRSGSKTFFSKMAAIEAVVLIFLAGIYIIQTNEVSKLTYFIPKYESEMAKFESQNQEMEMIVSAHNSQMDLSNVASSMNFEKIGNIEYIDAKDNKVAEKN